MTSDHLTKLRDRATSGRSIPLLEFLLFEISIQLARSNERAGPPPWFAPPAPGDDRFVGVTCSLQQRVTRSASPDATAALDNESSRRRRVWKALDSAGD